MPRLVRFHRLGGPEVLEIAEAEVDQPGDGEVRIAARALGLNRADSLFRSGAYIERPDLPSGSGLEASGVVESVGAGVTGLAPGDRVALVPPISMRQRPVHAERINVPAEHVIPIPGNQSFEEAAATWMAYLTAYGALLGLAGLQRGEHVVITAASSSVGLAAIQVVNVAGGVPIAVTRSDRKRTALLAAGAKQVVASDRADVAAAIREVAGPSGPRICFDAVGGALLQTLVSVAAVGGIVVSYGAQDSRASALPPAAILAKSLTLRGYLVHELIRDAPALEAAKAFILEHLASGALRPIIARRFPLGDIRAAYEFLESGEQFGKVVVTID